MLGSDWPVLTLAGSYAGVAGHRARRGRGTLRCRGRGRHARQRPGALPTPASSHPNPSILNREGHPMNVSTPDDRSIWADLRRPAPSWWAEAKLGIFIHWGAYSVPAWAEPSGALGAVPEQDWFRHNAYAEWYGNTIRIPGSPAAEHHREVYGMRRTTTSSTPGPPRRFDPTAWAELFAAAGASYVIPTTKHHDGIALWDAPGTGDPQHRAPRAAPGPGRGDRRRRRAVGAAVRRLLLRRAGLVRERLPAHQTSGEVRRPPADRRRLQRVRAPPRPGPHRALRPDILWNDIDWPDAGKRTGAWSLHELFDRLLRRPPRRRGQRPVGRHALGLPDQRVLPRARSGSPRTSGRTAAGSASRSATTRSRTRAVADRPAAGPPARRRRVPRRTPAAQRRTDRRGRDPGRPAGVAARTRPLDLRPR